MEEEKPLMEEEKNVETEPKKKERVCPCCSDTVCIGISWGIFAVLLIIFIFAVIMKYQKDDSGSSSSNGSNTDVKGK